MLQTIKFKSIDWSLFFLVVTLMIMGLITNFPGYGDLSGSLFVKQSVFVIISIFLILIFSQLDYKIFKGPLVSLALYILSIILLLGLFVFGTEINGANSWFFIGPFSIQPVDFVKIFLLVILATYFNVMHIYVKNIKTVAYSLFLTAPIFLLVFLQPDFGSSMTILGIWAGIIFVSGVSKKHIIFLFIISIFFVFSGWQFLPNYQQDRILSFLNPLEDLSGVGYNAYQSQVAVGSGGLFGKGIGGGTQSKLQFLPLYESDFVFAAFAEEWGFFGVVLMFLIYSALFFKLLNHAYRGRTNFETLFIVGFTAFMFVHILLHVGVNIGLLPVTGITLPFVSYGGSHLIAESILIGIVLGMAHMQRISLKDTKFYS